ncbi:hypothetical protein Lal_00044752 [Lupinus albus]|uniref:Uncharacterized protein n=1 Tax=Lupinus albus TaxID=3870 RepID=A0A6A5LDB7_LUPAL|nr:putative protein kinase RLK-Pelle-LRR-III family [Lupinus albus]KAF1858719.1 hypothetical protein Lal_00044752 [Lupinus albus]
MALITGTTHHHHHPLLPFIIPFLLFVVDAASDTELLLKFKESLQNNQVLSSWNASTPPCSAGNSHWIGVRCYNQHIWGLKLENMRLKGVIDVDSLTTLPYLRTISFMNNEFQSTWPELDKLVGLKNIYLSNNKFYGEIPGKAFENMKWLKKIHLSNNIFTCDIPTSLSYLTRLIDLRLDGNKFSGHIPPFHKTLKSLNVANNQLVGEIPAILSNMPASSFSGNQRLCGAPLEECSKKNPAIAKIIVIVVLVAAALVVIGVIMFVLRRRRKQQQSTDSMENPGAGASNNQKNRSETSSSDDANSDQRSTRSQCSSTRSKGENMKLSFVRDDREPFDLQELLRASAEILGSGCFSSSYKAALTNGPMMVVKRFKQMNNVGRDEFQEHMRRIGRLSHPNLLPLVAYYYRKEEKLLISDFVHNGSLAVRLHGYQALGQPSLDWPSRLKIVKGVAKGIEYLYKEMPSLIAPHGHLKSSNVLLSESLEPILNDYGLVPIINQDLAPDLMVIYKSPEYLQHGRVTKKTDVWSLGILILEILTGKLPTSFLQQCHNQGKGSELSLANWVDSIVPEEWSSEVFDKDMGVDKNNEEEMGKLLKIALACCQVDVDKRCDLKEAIDKIQQVKETDNNSNNEDEKIE